MSPSILLFICFSVFILKRSLVYLHYFQQEEYDAKRFINWIIDHKAFDKKLSIITFIAAIISFVSQSETITSLAIILYSGILLYFILNEDDPRKKGKKRLVLTKRAKRIYILSFLSLIAVIIFCYFFTSHLLLFILFIHLIPASLIIGNILLSPYEKHIQNKYISEAKLLLKKHDPKIIGITGSYGKTSIKHILGHILNSLQPTLFPPGSINTVMGITRFIRENLTAHTHFLIIEMGAYGKGSIKRLCDLTPPNWGIISTIGQAHYERFKSLETVAKAKFELAEEVLKSDGKIIISSSVAQFKNAQKVIKKDKKRFVTLYNNEKLSPQLSNIKQTTKGIEFTLTHDDKDHTVTAPIYGQHHAFNIALAFTLCLELGFEAEDICTSLKTLPQINHRLEVKPQENGTIIIDDAYNSNPEGFKSALKLLKLFKTEENRTVLITPGMVELGDAHDEEHKKIGKIAATHADIILCINPERIDSFCQAIETTHKEKLHLFSSFKEANLWLLHNHSNNDVILLENDLPDLYENIPSF